MGMALNPGMNSASRGGGPGEVAGEVSVHHRNGPFAMIACPGVNNTNGGGMVNLVTRTEEICRDALGLP